MVEYQFLVWLTYFRDSFLSPKKCCYFSNFQKRGNRAMMKKKKLLLCVRDRDPCRSFTSITLIEWTLLIHLVSWLYTAHTRTLTYHWHRCQSHMNIGRHRQWEKSVLLTMFWLSRSLVYMKISNVHSKMTKLREDKIIKIQNSFDGLKWTVRLDSLFCLHQSFHCISLIFYY